MEDLYSFFKSLTPGDVITSVGCAKRKSDEIILTINGERYKGWNKYARIAKIADVNSLKEGSTIGVIWEGINPNINDCFIHSACMSDKTKSNLRITNKTEHKAFIEEFVKNRMELAEHAIKESQDTIKRCRSRARELKKIAENENIDTSKLIKEK